MSLWIFTSVKVNIYFNQWQLMFCNRRCILPDLKSLALGIHILTIRTLGKFYYYLESSGKVFNVFIWTCFTCNCVMIGGIPAPVYFGALIDSACLKWSMKKCGGRGACRIYESNMYRYAMSYTCGPSQDCNGCFITCNFCLLSVLFLYFQDHLLGSGY